MTKEGVAIWRTEAESRFSGYLVRLVRKIDADDWVQELHFFGDGLAGDKRDKAFFQRLSFKRGRILKCGRFGV